jgi:hypothetical protein
LGQGTRNSHRARGGGSRGEYSFPSPSPRAGQATWSRTAGRLLEMIGPVSILPQAARGPRLGLHRGRRRQAHRGRTCPHVSPRATTLAGVIVYCAGMALFTMIMGNAFARLRGHNRGHRRTLRDRPGWESRRRLGPRSPPRLTAELS